jgi:small-conductance mechanosensitive channel
MSVFGVGGSLAGLAGAFLLAAAGPAAAEQEPAELELAKTATAPVVIDGVELFRVRGVSAFPAEQRAQAIEAAIRRVAADPAIPVERVEIVAGDVRTEIRVGDQPLLFVYDADARLEGVRRETLALGFQLRIRSAIGAYRSDRAPATLARHAAYAIGATLVFGAGIALTLWAGRRLDAGLTSRYRRRIEAIEVQSRNILPAERLFAAVRGVLGATRAGVLLLMAWAWGSTVLGLFPWTRGHAGRLADYVLDPLVRISTGLFGYLPNLIFLVILVFVTRYGLRILHLLAEAVARGAITFSRFEPDWAWPTYRIGRIAIVALVIVVAYPYIPGSESEAFKGISIFVGIVFSLGSSSVVSNILAGYSLIYRRTFKVGDRVKIDDVLGDVVEMRLQVTHLRSPKNEEVIVPNSQILNSKVVNYTSFARQHGLILHTTVGIGYEVPWRQVESMLLLAAERTPGLLPAPKPFVRQLALGDFAVTYELNAHCSDAQQMIPLYTELHRNVLDVFNEYGVQIMTPAYEGDPEQPKLVPPEQWYAPPAKR